MRQLHFLTAALLALLTGCSANQYAGISLTPGTAPDEIRHLAARAEDGDKAAMLELGIRFEEGDGVPRDLERAERLYRRAAESRPRIHYIYEPPLRPHGVGRYHPIQTGISSPGLIEARRRLEALLRSRETS